MNTPLTPEQCLQRIRVVLSRPSHPGNIGAAARAMKTMGLGSLVLVAPKDFPSPEADARAAGAIDVLGAAPVCESLDEALAGTVFAVALTARQRDLGPVSREVRQGMPELFRHLQQGPVALVFGNETAGLSNDEVQRCQMYLTIPTVSDFSSLNLGAAVQVLCYEARLAAFNEMEGAGAAVDTSPATAFYSPAATLDQVEGFYAHLERLMIETGFQDPQAPKRLLPKLRRLFGRAGLESDEVNILRGILSAAMPRSKQ